MAIDNSEAPGEIENDLRALEHRLAAWRPAPGALDRDRMLYDAGRSAARAESRIHSWRLATVALLLLFVGSGVLLLRQRHLLAREQTLLARERSQRLALETALAARTPAFSAERSQRLDEPTPIGRFAPSSYYALALQTRGFAEPYGPDSGTPPAERRREPGFSNKRPSAVPLRPRDIGRIIDL
jgi:hypothetical protein